MTDIVTVQTGIDFVAWRTPDAVLIAMPPQPKQAGVMPLPTFKLEEVAPKVIDALATQWLDHLYAKLGRPSPFALVSQPPDRGGG